jgi:hypothetical protein
MQSDVNFTKEAKGKSVFVLLRRMPETNDNKKNSQGSCSGKKIAAGTVAVGAAVGIVGAGIYYGSQYYSSDKK